MSVLTTAIMQQSEDLWKEIDAMKKNISSLDFDVNAKFPYNNFSDMRQYIDGLIQGLGL
jgi:hypothetical protein